MLATLVIVLFSSILTMALAGLNCKWGVKLYTFLSSEEYDSFSIPNIVRIIARLSDAIIKSLLTTEFLFVTGLAIVGEEWKFSLTTFFAILYFFLGPRIYRLALVAFSTPTPLWSKNPRHKDLGEIIFWFWCGLVTASDVAKRSVGAFLCLTSTVWHFYRIFN